jgi:hypothetical protein
MKQEKCFIYTSLGAKVLSSLQNLKVNANNTSIQSTLTLEVVSVERFVQTTRGVPTSFSNSLQTKLTLETLQLNVFEETLQCSGCGQNLLINKSSRRFSSFTLPSRNMIRNFQICCSGFFTSIGGYVR